MAVYVISKPDPATKVFHSFTIAAGQSASAAVDLGAYRATYIRPPLGWTGSRYIAFEQSPDNGATVDWMPVGADSPGGHAQIVLPFVAGLGMTMSPPLLWDHRYLKILSVGADGVPTVQAADRTFVVECQYAGY